MTVFSPISAIPTPELTDVPNVPLHALAMANQIDGMLVPTFVSAANRDATITSPVDGARCWRSDIHALQVYNSSLVLWQTVGQVQIAKTVLGSSTATVTFSSIPQDFTHLKLYAMVRSTKAASLDTMNLQINTDSGVHYEYANMTVSNSGTSSFTTSSSGSSSLVVSAAITAGSAVAGVFSRIFIEVPFYTDTATGTKNVMAQSNAAVNPLTIAAGNWIPTATAAVTTLSFTVGSGSFLTGSTFALYGFS